MYDLPSALAAALKQYAERADHDRLGRTTGRLIDRYQADHPAEPGQPIMGSADDALAYAAYRMPATYAAIRTVLGALPELPPELRLKSHLDIAGGTGAALWAVADRWPDVGSQMVLEQSEAAISLGRQLCRSATARSVEQATWRPTVLRDDCDLPPADLVTIGYLLSEIDRPLREAVINAALRRAGQMLIVVEPGTVAGYQRILAARAQVISAGWVIAAPCPHEQRCPLQDHQQQDQQQQDQQRRAQQRRAQQQKDHQQDWCHFSARLQRTAIHRRIKGAELGYEDEKFSYLVAVPQAMPRPVGRVLRHPWFAKGRVDLQVCHQSGQAERVTVAKRDQQQYRAARKIEWGDGWPPDLLRSPPGEP